MSPTEWFAWGQILFGALACIPFLAQDWRNRSWIARYPMPSCPPASAGELPQMTIIVCVLDEAEVIEGKLADLSNQDYPRDLLEVLVVDTGSTDRTLSLVEDWKQKDDDLGPLIRCLSTGGMTGKSAGVNLGLSEASAESEVIMLSDADSRLAKGALERVGRWFSNPDIGAVCGRQNPLGPDGELHTGSDAYRTFYNRSREAESRCDSTPIFDGSLAAYRRSAITAGVLEGANADDSQLAIEVRRQGLRAIHDSELRFLEATPTSLKGMHLQRVRRAQGLVRHLWRNNGLMFSRDMGSMPRIMRSLFFSHVKMPFFVLAALACGVALMCAPLYAAAPPDGMDYLLLVLDLGLLALFAISWLVDGIQPNRWRTIHAPVLSFIHAMWVLFWVHLRILSGTPSHVWQPVQEVRESISRFDQRTD